MNTNGRIQRQVEQEETERTEIMRNGLRKSLQGTVAFFVWFFVQNALAEPVMTDSERECVVLLHGMGRTSVSMKCLEHFLSRRGYQVVNVTYHSRRLSVNELSEQYLRELLLNRNISEARKVHFVTHSLGGIIVRQYLANHKIENLGRVVMLAPPNHGSEIIDWLRGNCFTRNFLGAAARQLGTGANDLPEKLGPVGFDCGVIAGDRSINPLLSAMLPGANDGKVSVASTKVEGMRDFLVVHGTHTWMMCKESVMKQTIGFLESGQFTCMN